MPCPAFPSQALRVANGCGTSTHDRADETGHLRRPGHQVTQEEGDHTDQHGRAVPMLFGPLSQKLLQWLESLFMTWLLRELSLREESSSAS